MPEQLDNLAELELALKNLSHDDRAVQLIRSFAENLGKTKYRQQVFNQYFSKCHYIRWHCTSRAR